ncbi:MAG: hypothetical protein ABI557_12410 [Aureliella sp.]
MRSSRHYSLTVKAAFPKSSAASVLRNIRVQAATGHEASLQSDQEACATLAAFALAVHQHCKPEEVVLRISELKSLEINVALWNDLSAVYQSLGLGDDTFPYD